MRSYVSPSKFQRFPLTHYSGLSKAIKADLYDVMKGVDELQDTLKCVQDTLKCVQCDICESDSKF
jgi:hypothetical protein